MSDDKVPGAWAIFDALTKLRDQMSDQHSRLRSDVNEIKDGLNVKIDDLRDDVQRVNLLVNTLQTQRQMDESQLQRRQWGIGILAGLVYLLIDWLFGWYSKR